MLCDIHGNLPALRAVLDEVEAVGVDLVVFGGDVAAGSMPAATMAAANAFTYMMPAMSVSVLTQLMPP